MTVGHLDHENNLIYVDTAFSGEKSFFIDTILDSGSYIILIEAYWTYKDVKELVFGSYSN